MIKEILNKKKLTFSMEVFPPKRDDNLDTVYRTLDEVRNLTPDFISVTYGAAGTTDNKTLEIASYIQNTCNIEALAHLTCVALNEDKLSLLLNDFNQHNIHNILALRGDRPQNMSDEEFTRRHFLHASDLIYNLNSKGFCIGAACYPEKHPEAENMHNDILNLNAKLNAGADFLITQLFLDNTAFFRFMDSIDAAGMKVPVLAGIMPITTYHQVETMIKLSGSTLPSKLISIIDKYKDDPLDFKKAGIDYAICQINELIEHNVRGIHLYSMNKADISKAIYESLDLD